MARPTANKPTITPFLRGNSLSLRLYYKSVKYLTPVLVKSVEASQQAKNGYLNTTYTNYVEANEKLAIHTDLLEKAAVLVSANLTEANVKATYFQLVAEAAEAAEVAAQKEARKKRMVVQVKHIDTEYSLPAIEEEIAELEAQLVSKKKERDTIKKFLGIYIDDTLVTLLQKYLDTKETTFADSTKRSYSSFIETVKQFDVTAKIEDIGEAWLGKFQDWLIATPAQKPIYSFEMYIDVDGKKKKRKDKILYYQQGETRKNSSIESYITQIKTVLAYFEERIELLPADAVINKTYRRFKFELPSREDNVVSLEESELFDLFKYQQTKKFGKWEKEKEMAVDVLLFLCATSLRASDLAKVTPATIKDGYINVVAKKTKKHNVKVSIPINPISASILQKYDYNMNNCTIAYSKINNRLTEVLDNPSLFPALQMLDNVTVHSGLKDVGSDKRRCELITTHSGRRTFINLCLDYNVPLNKIMGATGHTNVKTLMRYANKRKDVNKAMSNIFQFNLTEKEDYKLLAETIELTA